MPETPDTYSPRRFHLFVDVETTGLVPAVDSVLEIGWTITDENMIMLTPLRSRLALLTPEVDSATHMRHLTHPLMRERGGSNIFDPGDDSHVGSLPTAVLEMHEKSGLLDDLRNALDSDGLRMRMITQPRDFERLLFEDLAAAGFESDRGDRLIISGAGVSHFDVHVLAQHWPDLFPVMPSRADIAVYWSHDTSVAWRVLGDGVGKTVRGAAPGLDTLTPDSPWWSLYTANRDADRSLGHLIAYRSDGRSVFLRENLRPHRAADDVAASLLDARLLRDAVDILDPR